jgi:prepilin-type processing-associated H-X9-DG protein
MSLNELLVVIAILSVSVALIVPAVLYAREASRRTVCANQLRQLGVAFASYESANKAFPAHFGRNEYGAYVVLLPHLEQSALADSLDFSADFEVINEILGANRPSLFGCPSQPTGSADVAKRTAYLMNLGTAFSLLPDDIPTTDPLPYDGAFTLQQGRAFASRDFSDGLSNTAFVSEVAWYPNGDRGIVQFAPEDPVNVGEWKTLIDQCVAGADWEPLIGGHGSLWYGAGLQNAGYNHVTTPNTPGCELGPTQSSSYPASSWHTNGVHVLFGDGHTQFVTDDIDIETWRAIATRLNGESQTLSNN